MKLLSLTTSVDELKSLVPALRQLYFSCQVDGLSLISSRQEADLKANPWVHRWLIEYTAEPRDPALPLQPKELRAAARRALLEEQPDVVIYPEGSSLEAVLAPCLREAGIGHYTVQGGEKLVEFWSELKNRKIASVPRPPEGLASTVLMEEHWHRLGDHLEHASGPCLLVGQQALTKECRARFPQFDFRDQPEKGTDYHGVSLFSLSYTDKPQETLDLLRSRCRSSLLLEPVNTQMIGSRFTLRYGDYDNEFAFTEAEVDLKQALGAPHTTEVWSRRSGQAGDRPQPHPDGCYPIFASTLAAPQACWSERYRLPEKTSLKIVFADSGNVAGSVQHHAKAINRFTTSQAWAVTLSPHPLIGAQKDDDTTFFLDGKGGKPSPELEKVLREADCFVFFEDDDERSEAWPFPLHQYVEGKGVVHLYIGYRAHQRTARMQRPGRRILSPLPHILRMYPQALFYAGFPPSELLDIPLRPPQSATDGICRILHSPSVPHWTTARYPYHKDTEAFLRTARKLKKRYGDRIAIHQVGGWSQDEVVRARQICDITFNQLRGFHGLSGDEAMLLERPCVQAFDRCNINRHREYWGFDAEFPWLSTTREGLEETLSGLIENPERRAEIGQRSRAFMLKYFGPQKGILPLLFHCYQATGGAVSRGAGV